MKTFAIALLCLILTACVTTQAEQAKPPGPTAPALTLEDVAWILGEADKQLRDKGCEPGFLIERNNLMWARCQTQTVPQDPKWEYRALSLNPLIEQRVKAKGGGN